MEIQEDIASTTDSPARGNGRYASERARPIFVLGAPRTATTWVASVLSLGPGIRYLYEPVLQGRPPGFRPEMQYLYLKAKERHDAFGQMWDEALSLRFRMRNRWLLARSHWLPRRLPFWPARLLVKEVNAMLAVEYLAMRYQPRILLTIRHPCGYVNSGLRLSKLNMPVIKLEWLTSQPRLLDEHFPEHREWVLGLHDPIERMTAAYAMVYTVLARQLPSHPDWIFCRHEDLAAQPEEQFSTLYQRLGLNYGTRQSEFLRRTTQAHDENPFSVQRMATEEVEKWKHQLVQDQRDRVRRTLERFEFPYYNQSEDW